MNIDAFWEHVERQLVQLENATTADDVIAALDPSTTADAFFPGGGGDTLPSEPLVYEGDWTFVWYDASYYWCAQAPNGDRITYVEGDVYRGDTREGEQQS